MNFGASSGDEESEIVEPKTGNKFVLVTAILSVYPRCGMNLQPEHTVFTYPGLSLNIDIYIIGYS